MTLLARVSFVIRDATTAGGPVYFGRFLVRKLGLVNNALQQRILVVKRSECICPGGYSGPAVTVVDFHARAATP